MFFSPSGGVHVHECRKWRGYLYSKALYRAQTVSVRRVVSLAHFPTLSVLFELKAVGAYTLT